MLSFIYFFQIVLAIMKGHWPCRGDFPDPESLLWEATDETLVVAGSYWPIRITMLMKAPY